MEYFNIGGLLVCWDAEGGLPLPPGGYLEDFRTGAPGAGDPLLPRITFVSRYGDTTALAAAGEAVSEKLYTSLYRTERGRMLVHRLGRYQAGMVTFPDEFRAENREVRVECTFHPGFAAPDDPGTVVEAATVLGRAGLHLAMQQFGCGILHGSFIEWEGKAILFTAPSGVGKSTQAALWRQYAGATVVNGDRVLIRPDGDGFLACGYPACGSSDVCLDRRLPIAAIVALEQGSQNEIREMPAVEKVRRLVTAMELYRWHTAEMDAALDLAGKLAGAVLMPCLRCLPDEGAVRLLRDYLTARGGGNHAE